MWTSINDAREAAKTPHGDPARHEPTRGDPEPLPEDQEIDPPDDDDESDSDEDEDESDDGGR